MTSESQLLGPGEVRPERPRVEFTISEELGDRDRELHDRIVERAARRGRPRGGRGRGGIISTDNASRQKLQKFTQLLMGSMPVREVR